MAKAKTTAANEVRTAPAAEASSPKGRKNKDGFIEVGKHSVYDPARRAFISKEHLARLKK